MTMNDRVILPTLMLIGLLASSATATDGEWINLMGGKGLESWQGDCDGWIEAGNAELDPHDGRALVANPGKGVWISSLKGRADFRNLTSKERFADQEVHVEFLVSKHSNAGVKLLGLYEIQITDSHGKKKPTANDCGGIYPRAELKPRYHTIDEGVPPRSNAAKPAGQWQTLDITFRPPRFDAQGEKTENARFVKVVLNDQVIHEDVELQWPTGHAWRKDKEVDRGPLFLQGDHGPVAYRNVRVRIIPVRR